MPLKKGPESFHSNLKELVRHYNNGGKIGNVEPRNSKHAQKIAAAIAYKMKAKKKG